MGIFTIVLNIPDHDAAQMIQQLVNVCIQANCHKCLAESDYKVERALIGALSLGRTELVKLLFKIAKPSPRLPGVLAAAIRCGDRELLDELSINALDSLRPSLIPSPTYQTVRSIGAS